MPRLPARPLGPLLGLLLVLGLPGCAYRIGAGVTAGALDELGGEGNSPGLEGTTDAMLERALLVELGHQLGSGLSSGATEVTPEQQARLEQTIDGLLTVAARRTGKGLRNEVSPELREMVTKDIVGAFSDGLRNDLGDSLEHTIDRVVTRAVISLRRNLGEDETRWVVSDLLRDSVYFAMRENQGTYGTPAVAETLELTLQENVLAPVEQSVGGITDVVASQVEASARRTENTLKGVLAAVVLVAGVFFMLYLIRNRQVRALQAEAEASQRGLRNVDAALDLLDETSRAQVLAKLAEYQKVEHRDVKRTQPPPPERSDDYLR